MGPAQLFKTFKSGYGRSKVINWQKVTAPQSSSFMIEKIMLTFTICGKAKELHKSVVCVLSQKTKSPYSPRDIKLFSLLIIFKIFNILTNTNIPQL